MPTGPSRDNADSRLARLRREIRELEEQAAQKRDEAQALILQRHLGGKVVQS